MSCGCNNNIENNCNPKCQPTPCACAVRLNSDCITVVGATTECSGIDDGLLLTDFLSQIDAFICTKFNDLAGFTTLKNIGVGSEVYKGIDGIGRKEIRRINAVGDIVTVTQNTDDISISIDEDALGDFVENNQITYSASNVGTGTEVYKGETTPPVVGNVNFEFKTLNTNSLQLTEVGNDIFIDIIPSFEGTDYYVNSLYTGAEEKGTPSKPYKTLTKCLDRILNRAGEADPSINGGLPFEKWDLRAVDGDAIRVVIQSYVTVEENLAINRVTYFMARAFTTNLQVPNTVNLERIIDMKELVDNVPKVGGQLPYEISTSLIGQGYVSNFSPIRKGYVRAYGYNSGVVSTEQPDCNLNIGDTTSNLIFLMNKDTSLPYVNLYSDLADTVPIIRENVHMTGYQTTSIPDYGAFEVEGANAIFEQSLFLGGLLSISCYEQHMVYGKNRGAIYGDNGAIVMQRSYQHVNFDSIQSIDIAPPASPDDLRKFYVPSKHVYDVYLKNGSSFSYAGRFTSRQDTGANQGGSEAFICLESGSTPDSVCNFSADGGGVVYQLFYNHFFKIINHSSFGAYTSSSVVAKGLRMESLTFEHLLDIVDETDADYTDYVIPFNFLNSYMYNKFVFGFKNMPFTNLIINTTLGIQGDLISLSNSVMNSSLPNYVDNTAAVTDLMPIGSFYRDNNAFIKVVV